MTRTVQRLATFDKLLALAALCLYASAWAADSPDWTLSDRCPAGFAPDGENRCRLVSLYREYPSLQSRGMGGLKIGLPVIRDGFTPQQIDLGRLLFFDPLLSGNGQVCSNRHFRGARGR